MAKKPGHGGKKSKIFKILKIGALVFLFGAIVSIAAGITAVAYYSKDLPDPDKLIDRKVAESTKIYDRTGDHLLYEIHGDVQRTVLKLDDVTPNLKNAIIAVEDKDFYIHSGLSYKRTLYAIFKQLTGGGGPGASTLTQQLVKNAILTPERTIQRKIKEWVLTIQIERKFTKDQILQLYLNEIPMGSTAFGVEAAANSYFGKSAKDLSLAESATIAAMIQAPTYYSPFGSHRDELIKRQQLVLDLMAQQGYITKDDAAKAKAEKLQFKTVREAIEAPHFVFYVREQLVNNYGENIVEQGGLKVYTTLDYDMQKEAEAAIDANVDHIKKYNATNAALVAIDPKNGEVLAMVGSKDYFNTEDDGQVNVALSPRQPGSSFKPIVYATLFGKGYTPETTLYDVVTTFKTDTKDYEPHDYDNKERGPVSIRQALAGSLNIPAVKALYLAGIDRVLDLAQDMGYTTLNDRSRFGLSLVLGGGEVKLLEHVMSYSAFANDGVKNVAPVSILKVEDKDGKVLEEAQYKDKRVMTKEVAENITSILSDNNARTYIFGAKNSLTLSDRPVAAKTGTTNDYRDAWTMGYTPQLVAGVWVGNNDNSKMKQGADGSLVAAPIWNNFMSAALKGKDVLQFDAPPPNTATKPVLKGDSVGQQTVRIDRASGLLATDFTPASYVEQRTYSDNHDILYYVLKDDPNGPAPTDPVAADPQYQNWEDAVQKWATNQNKDTQVIADQPPTEYDNLHVPENRPNLTVSYPSNNQLINDNNLSVHVLASAPRGVSRVEYQVDDIIVATVTSYPFNLDSYSLGNFDNGFHDLKVRAYDDIDNSTEVHLTFNLLATSKPEVMIQWVKPEAGSVYSMSNFPMDVDVHLTHPENVKTISLYSINSHGSKELISTQAGPLGEHVLAKWALGIQPGRFGLIAEVETNNGALLKSDQISIYINP